MGNFLWIGVHNVEKAGKIHLIRWSLIARLVEVRGWGIIDPGTFNKALIIKNKWRVVAGEGIWVDIIKAKYM